MSWLPPFLLAFIAACAAWVAFQQWVIARQKLNHDLFDRRFAVYIAAEKYLAACLNRNGGTQEDTGAFYEATKPAPFLFDNDINEFLALIMKHSINIQIFSKYVEKPEVPEWQNYMNIYHTSQQWAGEAFGTLSRRFQASLNLSDTTPFSVTKIISIPDAQGLRDKITSALSTPDREILSPNPRNS